MTYHRSLKLHCSHGKYVLQQFSLNFVGRMKPYHITASEYLGQASFKISPLLKVPCRHQSQGNALGFCALASRPQAFSTAGFQVPSHTVCCISLVKADDTYFSLYKDSTKGTTQRYLHIHTPKKKKRQSSSINDNNKSHSVWQILIPSLHLQHNTARNSWET